MSRILTTFSLLILLCVVSSADVQHRKKQQKPSPAVQPQVQAAPAPQTAPPPPVTPEHGPSSPPDVNFQGGQLTIVARNSTMGDVLNAVRQKTGAAVEMPPASGERVVGQFGPGAPRDVMAQLLNGSHYDYVLLGSPAEPGALKKIVLMAKASGPAPAPTGQMNQPPTQNLQQVPEVESENPENNGEATPNGQPPEEEPQAEQPEQQEQPDQQDQQQQQAPQVKTPEQLLRELQQQQQQQQQDQSGPPGAPGQPPQQ